MYDEIGQIWLNFSRFKSNFCVKTESGQYPNGWVFRIAKENVPRLMDNRYTIILVNQMDV